MLSEEMQKWAKEQKIYIPPMRRVMLEDGRIITEYLDEIESQQPFLKEENKND